MARRLVAIQLSGAEYGVAVSDVFAAVGNLRISPLPGSPAVLAGVANMRGSLLPVLDLRPWLGLPQPGLGPEAAIVIVKADKLQAGLLVEQMTGMLSVPEEQVVPAPATGPPPTAAYLREAAQVDKKMLVIFDVAKYLTDTAGKFWGEAA